MTAEQFLVANQHFTKPLTEREKEIYIDNVIEHHVYVKRMIEFAKYHVHEALMAASLEVDYNFPGVPCTGVNKSSIRLSYPLDKIK